MKKGTTIYNGQVVETIDVTPTWSGLLPMLLELYGQAYCKRKNQFTVRQDTVDTIKELGAEFKNMAQAADKWNEHCKAEQARHEQDAYNAAFLAQLDEISNQY